MTSLFFSDPRRAVWWGTPTECMSAINRLLRTQEIDVPRRDIAYARLAVMRSDWLETPPSDQLRFDAERLLELYPLRTGDAFQLAAALHAQQSLTTALPFICRDDRLSDAARSEGFIVEP
jgi:predicted nucleic acid-binding protein